MHYVYYRQRPDEMPIEEYVKHLDELYSTLSKYSLGVSFLGEDGSLGIVVNDDIEQVDVDAIRSNPLCVRITQVNVPVSKPFVGNKLENFLLTITLQKSYAIYIKKIFGLFGILVKFRKVPDLERKTFVYEIYCEQASLGGVDKQRFIEFVRETQPILEENERRREEKGCYVSFSSVEIPLREVAIQMVDSKQIARNTAKRYNEEAGEGIFVMRDSFNKTYICATEKLYPQDKLAEIIKRDSIGYLSESLKFMNLLVSRFPELRERFVEIKYKGYKAKQVIRKHLEAGASQSEESED